MKYDEAPGPRPTLRWSEFVPGTVYTLAGSMSMAAPRLCVVVEGTKHLIDLSTGDVVASDRGDCHEPARQGYIAQLTARITYEE